MEDNWKPFKEIDFADTSIMQYHIDTRDFCCIINRNKSDKDIDFAKIKKYPENFFHSAEEVVETITRLYNDAGGEAKWRFLSLDGKGDKISSNWQMKYIRIYRTEQGLVVCNSNQYALSKDILKCEVNKECLHAH